METKYNMGLYFSGLVFMKAISDAVSGRFAMDTPILMEMLLVCMVFACVEGALFPRHREQTCLRRNTVLWVLLAHAAFPGGAAILGWFAPAPGWMLLLLLLTFEASLGAMWFGFHVALKQDSRQLNRRLQQYQNRV